VTELARVLRRIGYHVDRRAPGVVAIVGSDRTRTLARELARALADEPGGLPAAELARRVHRRRADVLRVLRADRRFEQHGSNRATRWHVARVPGHREQVQSAAEASDWLDDHLEARAAAERLSARPVGEARP
jgi:hypothetical protein